MSQHSSSSCGCRKPLPQPKGHPEGTGGETKATVGPTSASASKGLQREVPDAAVKIHAA